jgi:hypothetical protein
MGKILSVEKVLSVEKNAAVDVVGLSGNQPGIRAGQE